MGKNCSSLIKDGREKWAKISAEAVMTKPKGVLKQSNMAKMTEQEAPKKFCFGTLVNKNKQKFSIELKSLWAQKNFKVSWQLRNAIKDHIYNGTSVLLVNRMELVLSAKTDEYWTMQHFLLQGSSATHTSSSKCNKSGASAEYWNIFFSSKCNEYRVWRVLKSTSTEVRLYW